MCDFVVADKPPATRALGLCWAEIRTTELGPSTQFIQLMRRTPHVYPSITELDKPIRTLKEISATK